MFVAIFSSYFIVRPGFNFFLAPPLLPVEISNRMEGDEVCSAPLVLSLEARTVIKNNNGLDPPEPEARTVISLHTYD
jgi:hypothetical protein